MASKKTDVNPEIAEARGNFDEEVKSEETADVMLDASDRAGIEDNNPSVIREEQAPPLQHKETKEEVKEEEKLVELFIPWREGESEYFECSINLKKFKIKKNTPAKVPKYVRDFYYSYMKDTKNADISQNKLADKA